MAIKIPPEWIGWIGMIVYELIVPWIWIDALICITSDDCVHLQRNFRERVLCRSTQNSPFEWKFHSRFTLKLVFSHSIHSIQAKWMEWKVDWLRGIYTTMQQFKIFSIPLIPPQWINCDRTR